MLLVEQNLAVVRRLAEHVVVLDTGPRRLHRARPRAARRPRARPRAAGSAHEHRRPARDHRPRARRDVLPVASGLSLIYGLMGVLNFAHGAFLTVGAYAHVVLGDEARRRPGRAAVPPRCAGRARRRDARRGARRARPDPAALRPAHRAGARHRRARPLHHRARPVDLGARPEVRRAARRGRARRRASSAPRSRTTAGSRSSRPPLVLVGARPLPAPDPLRADRPRRRREPGDGDRARDRRPARVHARLRDRRGRRRARRRPVGALLRHGRSRSAARAC